MPDKRDKSSDQARLKKSQITRDDSTGRVLDPTNPASKPYGTTRDQIANMEGEGQARTPGQEPPDGVNEKAGKGRGKRGRR